MENETPTTETPSGEVPVNSSTDPAELGDTVNTQEIELLMQLVDNTYFIYQMLIVITVLIILITFVRRR